MCLEIVGKDIEVVVRIKGQLVMGEKNDQRVISLDRRTLLVRCQENKYLVENVDTENASLAILHGM